MPITGDPLIGDLSTASHHVYHHGYHHGYPLSNAALDHEKDNAKDSYYHLDLQGKEHHEADRDSVLGVGVAPHPFDMFGHSYLG